MMANLEYFQDGRYGEATQILDRCIMETALKSRWISEDRTDSRTLRFIEGSSLPDFELEETINENIALRGATLSIEQRMLASIESHRKLAGLNGRSKSTLQKLPDLAAITAQIGERRLIYTVVGKNGSHAVHGNWPNLLLTSLIKTTDGVLEPNFEGVSSHVNQYVMLPIMVLEAAISYLKNCFNDSSDREYFLAVVQSAIEGIFELNEEVIGSDFTAITTAP